MLAAEQPSQLRLVERALRLVELACRLGAGRSVVCFTGKLKQYVSVFQGAVLSAEEFELPLDATLFPKQLFGTGPILPKVWPSRIALEFLLSGG